MEHAGTSFADLPIPDWDPAWSEIPWDPSVIDRFSDLTFDLVAPVAQSAAMNMALDETLLYRVAEGRRNPVLWFWDWAEAAIILGSYQSVSNEIDAAAAEKEGFTFTRRISGGGAMLVEPGRTITYSLIVPEDLVTDLSYAQSFAVLDHWCVRALRAIGIPADYRPINDMTTPAGKLAGAAQCRRRRTVLHHTTMASAFDNDRMMRIMRLRRPVLNPKGVPSAVKYVSPLNMFTAMPRDAVIAWLIRAASRMLAVRPSSLLDDEVAEARDRMHAKFSARDWLYRVQ